MIVDIRDHLNLTERVSLSTATVILQNVLIEWMAYVELKDKYFILL